MSGVKPKQQQASLFSFFKKTDTKPAEPNDNKTAASPSANVTSPAANSAPKPAEPVKKPVATPKSETKPASPAKNVTVNKTPTEKKPSSNAGEDKDLVDSDEDSFALGKKRRLQKGAADKENSATKKATPTPPSTGGKAAKALQKPATKKGTLGAMDDDDDDAEFASESDDDGSAYSDEESEDDSSMDVDEESEDDDEVDEDSDDDRPRSKKRRTAAPKAKATKAAPASKPVAPSKARPSTTPSKSASLEPLKTPAKSLSASALTFATPKDTDGDDRSPSAAPSSASKVVLPEGVIAAGKHDHDAYSFLFPENIRDANNRRPGDAYYNPRTLKVPPKFLVEQTPAMAQWWQFKAQNMDTVLFFKVGKFYELFHMDADIGFKELDLIYMKGSKAHSGFPEVSYGKFASTLVSKGYRVARVEQTETPDMLKERNDSAAKGAKKDKVVARELCSVMTKGTRTFNHMDDLTLLDELGPDATTTSLLLCIVEVDRSAEQTQHLHTHGAWAEYGLCCVDTVLSTVTLAQFQDDRQRTRLRTFLARYNPTEVLLEDAAASAYTTSVLQLLTPTAARETLRAIDCDAKTNRVTRELPAADETLRLLAQGQYFATDERDAQRRQLPTVLQLVQTAYDADGSSGALALRALGGCLWQLQRSCIDHEILSMGSFEAYAPPDDHLHDRGAADDATDAADAAPDAAPDAAGYEIVAADEDEDGAAPLTGSSSASFFCADTIVVDDAGEAAAADEAARARHSLYTKNPAIASAIAPVARSVMILDETTLANLEVLVNNYDKTEKHSLWHFLNHTVTLGGRRLLRSWLCHPLYEPRDIALRQAAVQELCAHDDPLLVERMRKWMRMLPDLERLLLRVHSNGLRKRQTTADGRRGAGAFDAVSEHPDHRAVLFEAHVYTMRKIKDFADVLTGFETVAAVARMAAGGTWRSDILRTLLRTDDGADGGGVFPLAELQEVLKFFRDVFDEKAAKKEGQVKPKPGVNADYDAAVERIQQIHVQLETYLKDMKRATGISDVVYFGTGKDRFQLEVPMAQTAKVPRDWQSKSQKKTHRRYWTPILEQHVAALLKAEEDMVTAQQDTLRQLFAKFDAHRRLWQVGAQTMSILDALLSLAQTSSLPNYCWPEIVPFASRPVGGATNDAAATTGDEEDGVVLHIAQGRHPMLEQSLAEQQSSRGGGASFIPNSLQLGGRHRATSSSAASFCARTLVLTGPNMGGKSTLLRTSCLLTLMGQLGCKVPADRCRYTPVDRIFTRLGASDRLLAGQSTFFVELAETSLLLRASTRHSLCILDELGRGTATFDGTAIAHAVLEHLVGQVQCRVLFATHYHLLVEDWQCDSRVQMGHMDCLVQSRALTEEAAEPDAVEEVTFLYRLCAGSSPKSYGINVARLAGLPVDVIRMALAEAARFQQQTSQHATAAGDASHERHHHVAHFAAYRVMVALLERLVSLAHTYTPLVAVDAAADGSTKRSRVLAYEARAVDELAFHARELYARYEHLHQHHHVSDLLALS